MRPTPPDPHRPAQAGAALFASVITLVVVTAFATTLLTAVDTERTGVVIENDRTQALRFAEGVLEVAEATLIAQIANFQPFPNPPPNAPFQELTGQFQAGQLGASWTVSEGTTVQGGVEVAVPPVTQIEPMTGLQVTIEPHVLETTVQVGTSTLSVRRSIQTLKAPIFQFLSYYASDLEILPGPAMTLAGRIHTNGDLYAAPGHSLQVNTTYFRGANEFHRHRKDSGALPTGWIKIKDAVTGNMVTLPSKTDLAAVGIGSQFGIDSSFTGWDIDGDGEFIDPGELPPFKNVVEALYNGTFQTGEHGVQALAHPSIGSIQAYEPDPDGDYVPGVLPGTYVPVPAGTGTHSKGYFHGNADLTVIDDKVYDAAGTDITLLMPPGFVQTRTLWDQRENKWVTCTQLDLGKLGDMDGNPATYDPSPHYPDNGLIFAARADSVPGQPNGIVLTNGAELNTPAVWNSANYGGSSPLYPGSPPPGAFPFGNGEQIGLTVVSPAPVYVHGNYNTVSKKPAAVITDTINLLSASWDFTKVPNQVKTASSTTYNVAMITGNQNTSLNSYNGGFENLPRFHENWSGKTCTITGSFVNTWFSQVATGPWVYGGAWYSAPSRVWSYETMFDQGKLPPFTPMVVTTRTVAWEVTN
jgi:hypothetical protein